MITKEQEDRKNERRDLLLIVGLCLIVILIVLFLIFHGTSKCVSICKESNKIFNGSVNCIQDSCYCTCVNDKTKNTEQIVLPYLKSSYSDKDFNLSEIKIVGRDLRELFNLIDIEFIDEKTVKIEGKIYYLGGEDFLYLDRGLFPDIKVRWVETKKGDVADLDIIELIKKYGWCATSPSSDCPNYHRTSKNPTYISSSNGINAGGKSYSVQNNNLIETTTFLGGLITTTKNIEDDGTLINGKYIPLDSIKKASVNEDSCWCKNRAELFILDPIYCNREVSRDLKCDSVNNYKQSSSELWIATPIQSKVCTQGKIQDISCRILIKDNNGNIVYTLNYLQKINCDLSDKTICQIKVDANNFVGKYKVDFEITYLKETGIDKKVVIKKPNNPLELLLCESVSDCSADRFTADCECKSGFTATPGCILGKCQCLCEPVTNPSKCSVKYGKPNFAGTLREGLGCNEDVTQYTSKDLFCSNHKPADAPDGVTLVCCDDGQCGNA